MPFKLVSKLFASLTLLTPLILAVCSAAGHSGPPGAGSVASALSSGDGLVLRDRENAIFWSGTATTEPPNGQQPTACSDLGVTCAEFDLTIELPNHTWEHSGGVQVAIRWATDDNALDLFAYQHDAQTGADVQVGNSSGILAGISDSLLLRSAANGTYKVYVALDPSNSSDASASFEAEARVQYDPSVDPIRPLLPDLQFRPQTMVTFDTPFFPFFGDVADPGDSCFHLEKEEDGAQTCLRFQQEIANDGEGALELRFAIPHSLSDTSHNVFQRSYFRDDPVNHFQDTLAGTWEFHAAHQHYHFNNFAQSNLWAADSQGRRVGTAPVRTGRKVSFCVEDEALDPNKWGDKGVGPRTYHAPDCLFTAFSDTNFDYLIQGITKGWADIYEWYLPGQYIEVTGVSDGDYVLETIVGPDDKILETDDRKDLNNCGSVLIRLSQMGTPRRSVQLLGPGPACDRDRDPSH